MAVSRCLRSLALFLAGVEGARISRKRSSAPTTKFIAGVPVINYNMAYGGKATLGELESEAEQEWIMFLEPGTSASDVQRLCKINKNGCNLVGKKVPFLEMRGTEGDLEQVISGGQGAVKFVEPDVEDFLIPDVEEGVQGATWGLNRVGADDAGGRTGVGATIYVQDTGVRTTHQQFGGRAASALDLTSGSPVECNGDLNCAGDGHGHGTHCGGTAAGATYGVAPQALVRAVKTLSDAGSGSRSWQYSAIDWVDGNGARPAVISMSLGGSGADPGYTTVIDAAVNNGVTIVVAGGNSNSDACNFSPAFAENAITVGSTTSNDERSSFSNYGACTNIWAPGSDVLSAGIRSDDSSATMSGTSMACPHVAGAAALILSADPLKKASAVLAELTSMAEKDVLTGLKSGDVNHLLNLREPYTGPPTPAPPTPAPPPDGTWELTGDGCVMSGNCISSTNHPSNYGNGDACRVTLYGDIPLTTNAFNTESRYDTLIVGGVGYSGTSGPPSGSYTGAISWASDYSVSKSGWELCRTD